MTRSRSLATAAVCAAFAAALLSSCQASPAVDNSFVDSGGVRRCVRGQIYVTETAEEEDGNAVAGAGSELRRGSTCETEDNLEPGWESLHVNATLMKYREGGSFVCKSGIWRFTDSGRSVTSSAKSRCGAGFYYGNGHHFAKIGATTERSVSTVTPLAYNA